MNASYHIVSQTPILVDVNNDLTNFKAVFTVTGTEDKPFKIASTNQAVIDSQPIDSLEYQVVQKTISGELSSNDNIHHSHYLVLTSDSPTRVQVQIQAEALPTTTKTTKDTITTPIKTQEDTGGMDTTTYLIIGVICIIILYYIVKNTTLTNTPGKPSLLGSLRKLNV